MRDGTAAAEGVPVVVGVRVGLEGLGEGDTVGSRRNAVGEFPLFPCGAEGSWDQLFLSGEEIVCCSPPVAPFEGRGGLLS